AYCSGGLEVGGAGTSARVDNTIIAGNRQSDGSNRDLAIISSGNFAPDSSHNLIGYNPDEFFPSNNGNKIGVNSPIDPRLGPLGNYGGPTKTHVLLVGSPAIDAGDDSRAVGANGVTLTVDQRGQNR